MLELVMMREKAERVLDQYFSNEFDVRPVPGDDFYKRGIDRTFIHKAGRYCWGVQYIVDPRDKPGDAILPHKMSGPEGHRSWVYTSHAQVIVYYIPTLDLAYLCYSSKLKFDFFEWTKEVRYNNQDAVKVPLKLFSEASYKQERIPWATTP